MRTFALVTAPLAFALTVQAADPLKLTDTSVLTSPDKWVRSVAISGDGKVLASVSARSIILWDIGKKEKLRTITGHADRVMSVRFSPKADRLVSGGEDRTVRVSDVATGKELLLL